MLENIETEEVDDQPWSVAQQVEIWFRGALKRAVRMVLESELPDMNGED